MNTLRKPTAWTRRGPERFVIPTTTDKKYFVTSELCAKCGSNMFKVGVDMLWCCSQVCDHIVVTETETIPTIAIVTLCN